jgi:hypothetical protein
VLKTTITAIVLILAVSCAKDNCGQLQKKLANAIATQLECSNAMEIQKDIEKIMPANCKDKQMGITCGLLVDPLVEIVVSAATPNNWGCTATKTKEQLKIILSGICSTI